MKQIRSWIALGALVLAAVVGYTAVVQARAKLDRKRAVLEDTLDSLARQTAKVDTIYVRDSVTVWRLKRATDTLTVTVHQWKHDTVKVVEYVERADSTIRACSQLVLTCEARVALRDSTIATQQRRWDTREKPRPPLLVWGERGLIFWLGTKVR